MGNYFVYLVERNLPRVIYIAWKILDKLRCYFADELGTQLAPSYMLDIKNTHNSGYDFYGAFHCINLELPLTLQNRAPIREKELL